MDVDPDIVPNLNQEGVFQYLIEQGYVVTRWAVKMAVIEHRIARTPHGGKNLFSRRDAREWIASLREPARSESVAAQ